MAGGFAIRPGHGGRTMSILCALFTSVRPGLFTFLPIPFHLAFDDVESGDTVLVASGIYDDAMCGCSSPARPPSLLSEELGRRLRYRRRQLAVYLVPLAAVSVSGGWGGYNRQVYAAQFSQWSDLRRLRRTAQSDCVFRSKSAWMTITIQQEGRLPSGWGGGDH